MLNVTWCLVQLLFKQTSKWFTELCSLYIYAPYTPYVPKVSQFLISESMYIMRFLHPIIPQTKHSWFKEFLMNQSSVYAFSPVHLHFQKLMKYHCEKKIWYLPKSFNQNGFSRTHRNLLWYLPII